MVVLTKIGEIPEKPDRNTQYPRVTVCQRIGPCLYQMIWQHADDLILVFLKIQQIPVVINAAPWSAAIGWKYIR